MKKLSNIFLILILVVACKQAENSKTEVEPKDSIIVMSESKKELIQEKEKPQISDKIKIVNYKQKTVLNISDTNAYLIEEGFFPEINLQTDFIKRYFWRYHSYNDTSNSIKEMCYALFQNDNGYYLDTVMTYKTLIEFEGCNESHEVNLYDSKEKAFLLFDKSAKLEIGKVDYLSMMRYEYQVPPSQKILIRSDSSYISLDYNAILCEKTFQYKGLGTIQPTFFNIKLELFDSRTNYKKDLFVSPHQHTALLHDIWVGDINNDSIYDYILTIYASDVCEYRSLFLSDSTSIEILDYKGSYEMCDCP
jgi:hypothetical protein